MFATERLRGSGKAYGRVVAGAALVTSAVAALTLVAARRPSQDAHVAALIKARLPRTAVTRVDCGKIAGLCEVTAGANLFYVDAGGRYLTIGRVYDMETRQDLTAARLLEINPDLLVGGAAKANAVAGASAEGEARGSSLPSPRLGSHRTLSLADLPASGAIIWGRANAPTITVFTDFRCGYCRALAAELLKMDVRVVERPISVLGSRDLADRVYCAPDRARALRAAYAGETLATGAGCDRSGLDANERFARSHGLTGTPVIVRSDGEMLEGYRPRAFLEPWIKGARS